MNRDDVAHTVECVAMCVMNSWGKLMPEMVFLMMILTMIVVDPSAGGEMSEGMDGDGGDDNHSAAMMYAKLNEHFHVTRDHDHPILGDITELVKKFEKNQYIKKTKNKDQTSVFSMGERGSQEVRIKDHSVIFRLVLKIS